MLEEAIVKKITKRPYQEECVNKLVEYFNSTKKQKPQLLIAPTAAGKSWLIAWTLEQLNDPTLILQPSEILLEQNYQKFRKVGGKAAIYSASKGKKELGRFIYATIGSIKNLGTFLKEYGIKNVIIDEVHTYSTSKGDEDKGTKDGMLRKLMTDLGTTKIIGLSASPMKTKVYGGRYDPYTQLNLLNRTVPRFFSDILHVIQISEMIENGYWKNIEYKCFNPKTKYLELNKNGSEYTEASLRRWYKENQVLKDILKCIEVALKHGKKTILVFLPSVDHCLEAHKAFPNSVVLHGEMSKNERDKALEKYKTGEVNVAFSVEVLTTGFDHDLIDCLILGRITNSLSLYYQMVGRLVRWHEFVKLGTVIDLVGLVKKFGKIEEFNFEKIEGYGWGMFSGERLLTGIRIDDERHVTKKMLFKPTLPKVNGKKQSVFKVGKYQYVPLKEIPKEYLKWAIQNMDFKKDVKLKQEILNLI